MKGSLVKGGESEEGESPGVFNLGRCGRFHPLARSMYRAAL